MAKKKLNPKPMMPAKSGAAIASVDPEYNEVCPFCWTMHVAERPAS